MSKATGNLNLTSSLAYQHTQNREDEAEKDGLPGRVLVSVSYSVVCSTEVVVTVVPGAWDTEVTVTSTVDVLH